MAGIKEYPVLHMVKGFGGLVRHQRLYTRLHVYQCVFSRVHSVADSSIHGSFSFMFEIFPLTTAAYPFVKIVGNISTSLRF